MTLPTSETPIVEEQRSLRSDGGRWRPALAGILLLAFGLRVLTISNQSLWFDEAFSLLLSRHDFPEIAARTARDTMPPLYYWLLHVWPPLPVGEGGGEGVPRSLSAITGTLSVALSFVIARRLLSTPAALWAALFTAIAPFQVFYGQEVRMYALLGVWSLLAAYGFIVGWRDNDRRGWVLYGLGTALAMYTHPLGGLPSFALVAWAVGMAVGGFVGWRRVHPYPNLPLSKGEGTITEGPTTIGTRPLSPARERDRVRGLPGNLSNGDNPRQSLTLLRAPGLALAIAGIAYLPWLSVLVGQAQQVLNSFWASPPSVVSPLASFYLFFEGPFGGRFFPVLLAVILVPLAFGLIAFRYSSLSERLSLSLLWAWLALPLLALLALSLVRSVYLERVVIGASFPIYIVLGWTVATLRPRAIGTSLGVAVLAAGVVGLAGWFGDPSMGKPPQREAASVVVAQWREGVPVVHTSDGSYLPFLLYAPHIDNQLLAGDPEAIAHTARARSTYDTLGVHAMPLADAVRGASEFTVVIALDHSVEWQLEQAAALDSAYTRIDEQNVGGILVRRYRVR